MPPNSIKAQPCTRPILFFFFYRKVIQMHTGSFCSKSQSVILFLFMLSTFHTYFIWKFYEIIFTYAQILNVCKVTGKESKYGIVNIINSGILIFKQPWERQFVLNCHKVWKIRGKIKVFARWREVWLGSNYQEFKQPRVREISILL